jgi:hypothetical protein
MSEMVERASRAILERVPAGYGMTAAEAADYARAAFEVARESTYEMRIAGVRAGVEAGLSGVWDSPSGVSIPDAWRAMVDEILKD